MNRFLPLFFIAFSCAPGQLQAKVEETPVTRVQMNNVNFWLTDSIILWIRYLDGKLLPNGKGPPVFDDKNSFVLDIDSAEVWVNAASLTQLMNQYVFADRDSPIKKLSISMEGNQIKQKGVLHKGVDLPIEILGSVSATSEGQIRIHPTKIKTAHLPVKGLMELFGVDVAGLINTKKTRGVRVEKSDLILYPELMLPPPRMRGRIKSVSIAGDNLVQTFGNGKKSRRRAGNYLSFLGGTIRFGKLTMNDADMVLLDVDAKNHPGAPFDFFLDHYKEQLMAGYSKTTASFGLEVYIPDYSRGAREGSRSSSNQPAAR